jgi:hypothetical protein
MPRYESYFNSVAAEFGAKATSHIFCTGLGAVTATKQSEHKKKKPKTTIRTGLPIFSSRETDRWNLQMPAWS